MIEKPNYYAILTANVRYDARLKPNEKLLYAEITALSNAKGKCFATNKYFASLFNVSSTAVSKWISNLTKYGYLESVLSYVEGTKQIDKRYITIVNGGIQQNFNTPIEQNFKDNNTSINNTSINNKKNKKKSVAIIELPKHLTHMLSPLTIEKFNEFLAYRKNDKKVPITTEKGITFILNKLGKEFANEDHLIQCIDHAIGNEYRGVKGEYVKYQPKEITYRTSEEKNYYRLLDLKKRDPDGVTSEEIEEKRVAMEKSLEGITNA